MSRFTDDMYRQWLGRNGSYSPRRPPARGMGGMPPMVTAAPAPAPIPSRDAASMDGQSSSRHEKQGSLLSDYVDNQ